MSGRIGHGEIYSMDADGTNTEPLTPIDRSPGALRADPDWSPDGQVIALTSSVAGTLQVMTISLRDRSLRQLTSSGRNEGPSWAPDGRHLVFTSNRTGVKQLWVLDVTSGRTRQLTTGTQKTQYAAWSPRF